MIRFTRTEKNRLNADPIFRSQREWVASVDQDDAAASSRIARTVRFNRDCEICCGFHGVFACPSDPRTAVAS